MSKIKWRPFPWATGLVTTLALVVWFWPAVQLPLVYERGAILHGDIWRLWTGHLTHLSLSHLVWNLIVFLPAGIWAERISPVRTRWLLLLAPGVIGAALLGLVPALEYYAGLSGLAAAVVALLAMIQLQRNHRDRWWWLGVLALIALKILAEALLGLPVFARFRDPSVHVVPLAHFAGVLCAAAACYLRPRKVPPSR